MQQLLNSKSLTLNQVYWETREILSSMCIMCCTSLSDRDPVILTGRFHMDTDYLVRWCCSAMHRAGPGSLHAADSWTSIYTRRIPLTPRTLSQQKRFRIDLAGVTTAQWCCLSLFPLLPPAAWQETGREAPPPHPAQILHRHVSCCFCQCVCVLHCRKFS